MKSAASFALVLVTAPDLRVARRLARGALRAKLIACANLVPKIESWYWWEDRMVSGLEVLMICKTAQRRLKAFEKFVLENHPYDTPEFVVLSPAQATQRYLAWINASVK